MGIQKYVTLPKGSGVPKWANGIVIVGSVFLFGTIAFFIYKKYKKGQEEKDSKQTVKAVDDELTTIKKQGGSNAVPSAPQSTYESTANFIKVSLDGCEMGGTELTVIEAICKLVKKPVDWLLLVKAFGVRSINDCAPWGGTTYDLPTLLKDQLDTSVFGYSMDINGYKKSGLRAANSITILTDYLTSKGITI